MNMLKHMCLGFCSYLKSMQEKITRPISILYLGVALPLVVLGVCFRGAVVLLPEVGRDDGLLDVDQLRVQNLTVDLHHADVVVRVLHRVCNRAIGLLAYFWT